MNKCYIYFYEGYVSVAPTVISIAKLMSLHFNEVIIFCKDTGFERYQFQEKNIKLYYVNEHCHYRKKVENKNFLYCILKYFFTHGISKQDLMICIDNKPLKNCNLIYKWLKIPFVFLSLELVLEESISNSEKKSFSNSKAVLIQDENRLKLLQNIYSYGGNEFKIPHFIAPNISISNDKKNPNMESMVAQFKNIPENKLKCASIGMINKYVYSYEIAKVFNNIDNAVLIYHDRIKINKEHKYVKSIIEINPNTYLSNVVYNFDDIGYVYEGIDIGIATYLPSGRGFDSIGHASGKLTFYLKYKKPVIVNDIEGFSDIVSQYDCGIIIKDINSVQEWQDAINKINDNYNYYSENSYKAYLNEFDFITKMQPFCNYLETIIK